MKDRQTDRQTDRQREREGGREGGFFSSQTFIQGLKITGEKHAGNLTVGESIAQKAAPWTIGALCLILPCTFNVSLVLNLALCI